MKVYKKKTKIILIAVSFILFSSVTCYGAVQRVNADTNIDADGEADGIEFRADAVLTVTDGATVNADDHASGVTTKTDGTGTITFLGASVTKGDFGGAKAIKEMNLNGDGKTVSTNGDLTINTINFGADSIIRSTILFITL